MKFFLSVKLIILISLLFSNCSNQRVEGKGKLRLHTMYFKKVDVLNLNEAQTLYFNIDFENRKVAKEHLRLAGFLYRSQQTDLSPITMKYSVSDTVVSENKVFGNYFLKQSLIAKIKTMEANGELSNTDHFVLKPQILDNAERYISYVLYVGSDERVFDLTGNGKNELYISAGNNTNVKMAKIIDQLDPSPPAPPQY